MTEYKVSQEIIKLFEEASAAEQCRDVAVKSVFRAKRAIYYGRESNNKKNKAWKLFFEMYPELGGRHTYLYSKRVVVPTEQLENEGQAE